MAVKKRDSSGIVDMIAHVPVDDYIALKSGEAVVNNGIRRKNGTIRSNGIVLEDITEPEDNYKPYEYVESSKEDDELAKFIGELAAVVIIELVHVATPYIKRWWKDTAVPGMKKTWNSITKKEESLRPIEGEDSDKVYTTEIATSNGITPDMISKGVDEAYENYREKISNEEAQKQLIDIAILSAILAGKIRRFSSVCIKEDGEIPDNYLEWQKAMEKLTTRKVTDSINTILEGNASLLDENRARTLSDIMGYSVIKDGKFIPIENYRFKQVLSLECDM